MIYTPESELIPSEPFPMIAFAITVSPELLMIAALAVVVWYFARLLLGS